MEILTDKRWVLLEEGYPYMIELTKEEGDEMLNKYKRMYPYLTYSLFWDEYYEFNEITNTN